jgi:hypothetical protein
MESRSSGRLFHVAWLAAQSGGFPRFSPGCDKLSATRMRHGWAAGAVCTWGMSSVVTRPEISCYRRLNLRLDIAIISSYNVSPTEAMGTTWAEAGFFMPGGS